jgi:hypothetical protein
MRALTVFAGMPRLPRGVSTISYLHGLIVTRNSCRGHPTVRIARNIVATLLGGTALFATGSAGAAQLTLNWVDNAGGAAYFTIERKTDGAGAYVPIATTNTGATTYADSTAVVGTMYCYRVKASNAGGDSGYSDEACGSPAAGFDFTVAKAGSGSGKIVSSPAGIDCGSNCVATYAAGKVITLTATPASGSSFSGWSGGACAGTDPCVLAGNTPVTVTATFSLDSTAPTASIASAAGGAASNSQIVSSPAMTLAYQGMLRDRVGQGETALGPDGTPDGTLTVTLSASGGRIVTALRLDGDYAPAPGRWLTNSLGTTHYVLGVAPTLDGAMLNAPGTMAVNFAVPDGGSFVLFGADWENTGFQPGRTLTLTASFADGSTATAVTTVVAPAPATLTLAYNGKLRDRVGQGNQALASDGALDGTLTATLSAPGGRTVTALRLDSSAPGTWVTSSAGTTYFVLGVASTVDGTMLNAPGTMALNFPVADGGSFVVFASDYLEGEFLPGRTLTLTATFADGSTATAVTTVP